MLHGHLEATQGCCDHYASYECLFCIISAAKSTWKAQLAILENNESPVSEGPREAVQQPIGAGEDGSTSSVAQQLHAALKASRWC